MHAHTNKNHLISNDVFILAVYVRLFVQNKNKLSLRKTKQTQMSFNLSESALFDWQPNELTMISRISRCNENWKSLFNCFVCWCVSWCACCVGRNNGESVKPCNFIKSFRLEHQFKVALKRNTKQNFIFAGNNWKRTQWINE